VAGDKAAEKAAVDSPVEPSVETPAKAPSRRDRADLLRFATAGSVDDGKSTLIGRLLYDSKTLFIDQLAAVERTSKERGNDYTDLALLTDGLRAEREQGITIDVAYRSFVTPTRRFQLADAPGHVQYTRNMVTGASTADVAVVLLDARKGVIEQTRRHTYISTILGTPHHVFAVNKMDLVDFDETRFREIAADLEELCARLGVRDAVAVPISALTGDNVVERSERMPWWTEGTFLERLERIEIAADRDASHRRFPVQWVIRPMSDEHHDYRGYAGEVAGGEWRAGDNNYSLETRRRIEAKNPQLIKDVFQPARVIDLGCGPGALMHLLHEIGVEADGIDLRALDIDEWRRHVTAVFQDFVRFELPLRDGSKALAVEVPGNVIWSRIEGLSRQAGIQFPTPPPALQELIDSLG